MKVCLDTTYLLPICRVKVIQIPTEFLENLFKGDFDFCISNLTLLELIGKSIKILKDTKEIEQGLEAILQEEKIEKVGILNIELLKMAIEYKSKGLDLIDSMIVATARLHADLLLTEAEEIKDKVKEIEVLNWKEFQDRYF